MSKLLLIDCYSLLFRAFFSSPPFSTAAGEPTGALYGFIRMVTRLLDENQPDFAVVAIDAPGGTFRHEADETYKANRSETPSDLKVQQKLVRELLDGLSIPRYEHAGFEADDIIGTLAKRGEAHGQEVVIFTGDGDYLQLVDENIQVFLTRKGVSDLEAYNPAAIQARFGFEAALLPDFKGLKGDASDNIPGVPGIGDKTAMSLVQKFGSLEKIYENLEEVTPPRIKELLRTHQDQAFHSKTMATIVVDLPVEREPEDFRYDPIDPEKRRKAAATARRFEFKSLAQRFETPLESAAQVEPEIAPVKPFESTLEITNDAKTALDWLQKRGDKALIAISQTEDGLIVASEGEALLLTQIGSETAMQPQTSLDFGEEKAAQHPLKNWLEDASKPKIAHDAKLLMRQFQAQGVKLQGVAADTMVMGYLCEPTRQQHTLPHLAEKFLRYSLPEAPVAKKKTKNTTLFEEGDNSEEVQTRRQHLATQTAVLVELEPVLRVAMAEIGHEKLFAEMELPLIEVLAQMECVGMLIDSQPLRVLGDKLQADISRLELEIWEIAGQKFTIGSPKQLQEILFDKLKLDTGRKNKSGGYSTDAFTLEKLAEEHEIVRKVLEYRGATKLKSTYVDALLNTMSGSFRVHSTLNQTGTVSGRLSSSDPNLQNVPIRTEQGRLIRAAFIAPPDHVILSADYSQIELRILAHITGDLPLVDAFNSGEDVHARTAAALFHMDAKDVDKEQRRLAKMTNYAIAYGVSGFGLAKQLGTGNASEANEFIKTYFETLPGVKKYIDDTLKEAKTRGYVETLAGRKRPLPEINANAFQVRAAAERTAINHPIQGTAADMMKLAMLAIESEIESRELRSSMTMQVHDELVFEVPTEEIELMTELVKRHMSEVPARYFKLKVPLVADVGTGVNWQDAKGRE
ncbi:DNA polymerase I [Abditibacterium utsteinense]|uniref:DNA polymerase I n=1 Tax=Abditibacterium utsteinense TaxID=1960156 RepID=A0A2S8SS69_9BACT|nr:DNA polymerase I [Abditibacterium utsteinense]PQV63662.1 DNA polymerase I [Abditibacterium utsteinense]